MCKQQQVNIKRNFSIFFSSYYSFTTPLASVKWWTLKLSRGKIFPFIIFSPDFASIFSFADSVMMLKCQNVNIVDRINTSSALSFHHKTSITRRPRKQWKDEIFTVKKWAESYCLKALWAHELQQIWIKILTMLFDTWNPFSFFFSSVSRQTNALNGKHLLFENKNKIKTEKVCNESKENKIQNSLRWRN